MTRAAALRALVTARRDHHHQGRIGLAPRRDGYDRPDGREKLTHVVRVLRSVLPMSQRRIAS